MVTTPWLLAYLLRNTNVKAGGRTASGQRERALHLLQTFVNFPVPRVEQKICFQGSQGVISQGSVHWDGEPPPLVSDTFVAIWKEQDLATLVGPPTVSFAALLWCSSSSYAMKRARNLQSVEIDAAKMLVQAIGMLFYINGTKF